MKWCLDYQCAEKEKEMNKKTLATFLAERRPLVMYVRNEHGFKKGVVVALDKNRIGWSLVNKEDYLPYLGNVWGVPAIQRLINELKDVDLGPLQTIDILKNHPSFKALCAGYNQPPLMVPYFDKGEGFGRAIKRAFKNTDVENLPSDPDLIDTVNRMIKYAAECERFKDS